MFNVTHDYEEGIDSIIFGYKKDIENDERLTKSISKENYTRMIKELQTVIGWKIAGAGSLLDSIKIFSRELWPTPHR